MSAHDLTDLTGSFGTWQKRIFFVLFYVNIVGMWHNLSITFLAPNMEYNCTNASTSEDRCFVTYDNISTPCTEWEYDTSFYSQTIVNEWDLVCEREWLVALAKSVYMFGFLLSVLIFGQISDWIGRYKVVVITYFITVASLVLSLFSTSYFMFIILRFFQAFGRTGLTTTGFVLLMEIVGAEHRTKIGIAIQVGWAVGFATLAGVAYLARHWFWLQFAMTVPILPVIIALWIIPESPRWLLMKGRMKQLEKLLKKAAKTNGKTLTLEAKELEAIRNQETKPRTKSILDLFKTPRTRKRTIIMMYSWIVTAFTYYGLSYNTNDLAGNPYINFTVAGMLEFPCYALVFWLIKRFGRRISLVSFTVVGGVSCLLMGFIHSYKPWLATTLAMLGKFCISGSFGILYLYTSELFPTVVRNVALGSCSMLGRFGAILAPFVTELEKVTYPWFPGVVYGGLACSSGLLALMLPETKGRRIPDTLEEGERFSLSCGEEVMSSFAMQEHNETSFKK